MKKILMYFDGACDNNSKLSFMGCGVAVFLNEKTDKGRIKELDKYFMAGSNGTSNIAEYDALLCALKLAIEMKNGSIPDFSDQYDFYIFGDSQLIVNQVNGKWRCRAEHLQEYHKTAKLYISHLGRNFKSLNWIRRHLNTEADELSKRAIVEYISK